jgi:hypothetical protein
MTIPRAFFLFFFNIFIFLPTTSKLQGLGLVWVQIPKELYMKKNTKTSKSLGEQTKIHKQMVFAFRVEPYINNV